ncbi:uncharacterized protein L969DRAFT_45847 [Mixia osmundae IAM 14324]|uniref:Uncharacterized protein n=1 Tax=Mixia osmundae (strain CBS 9802 / IAM 14324 / JCM 22182 / KY 12970) TaxID=764103 RepID=G7DUB7_MIXOS|nr:uncharacterized protein L969DRAFT_45847 [Mixia osmundae IAM 14324]KEI41049.1 hypothetical protein L969DRAFT_45847 [Mixia osmundae IAM 14324]GAA94177.1 hypothetical protein E5Q_00825 [Mixia osmundae IAM 14324]
MPAHYLLAKTLASICKSKRDAASLQRSTLGRFKVCHARSSGRSISSSGAPTLLNSASFVEKPAVPCRRCAPASAESLLSTLERTFLLALVHIRDPFNDDRVSRVLILGSTSSPAYRKAAFIVHWTT